MKITVIGAGHGGTATAAYLALNGHYVKMLKTSRAIHNEHFNAIKERGNKIKFIRNNVEHEAKLISVTTDFKEAICGSDIIIIFVQTNYHEEIVKKLKDYVYDQIIIFEPGYLGTLYFLKELEDTTELKFVEAQSSPFNCRIIEPGVVKVNSENVRNPIGIYPDRNKDYVYKRLKKLNLRFVTVDSIFEAALHNPNLIVHTVGGFMSIPRIEYTDGEYWMYKEVFTPSVWNLLEGLDGEKMDIMERLGCERMPYVEASKYRNSLDDTVDAKEDFFYWAYNLSSKGPTVSNSRYLTEDVPQGLVLLESIGKYVNVETPICSSIINLASAALNQDFRDNGRTLDSLGIEGFEKLFYDSKK